MWSHFEQVLDSRKELFASVLASVFGYDQETVTVRRRHVVPVTDLALLPGQPGEPGLPVFLREVSGREASGQA